MFCTQCGKSIDSASHFCPFCGAAHPVSNPSWYDQEPTEPIPDSASLPAPMTAAPAEDLRIAPMKRAFHLSTLATLVVFAVQGLLIGLGIAILVTALLVPVLASVDLTENPYYFFSADITDYFKDPKTSTLLGLGYAGIYTVSMLLGILVAGLLRRQVRRVPLPRHPLPFRHFLMAALVTFGLWGAGTLLGIWPQLVAPIDLYLPLEDSIPVLLVTVIGAPVFEELIFRKFLIDRLLPFGERTTVVFTALLFGMAHQNAMQFFLAFFVGLVFAVVYIRTGNILYTMLLHFMVNSFVELDVIGCKLFGDRFDTVWLIAAVVLGLAGFVTALVCRKHPFFSTVPNYIPGANRAAFHGWGMVLCKVIVTVEIVIYALLMVVSSENSVVGLVHLIPAALAVTVIFVVSGRTSARMAPAPEPGWGNVTES